MNQSDNLIEIIQWRGPDMSPFSAIGIFLLLKNRIRITRRWRSTGIALLLLSCLTPSPSFANENQWAIAFAQASQVRGGLVNTLSEHWPTSIAFLRVAKEIAGSKEGLGWEVEGQLVRHYGMQEHYETNGLVVARWHPFFWDRYLDTSFAIGEGLSYATKVPQVEVQRGQDTAKLLNYLLFEMTFALPKYPDQQLVALMHHRSGAFGLFSGVSGGSNYFGFGVKSLF